MQLSELTAISPLDGRYAKKTAMLRPISSEYGLIRFRVFVETEWLKTLANTLPELKKLTPEEKNFLHQLNENFNEQQAEEVKKLEKETNHDVKAVEYFLKAQLKAANHSRLEEWVHFGCTSEDINNIAYALMINTARAQCCVPQMMELTIQIATLAKNTADASMLAHTHGQPATPTTMGKEMANFAYRLNTLMEQFKTVSITAKCNGAVGNFNAHIVTYPDIDWLKVTKNFIESFGLQYHPYTTQIEPHDQLATLFHALTRFNTVLIDFSRDIWQYISLGYFTQKQKKHETGSSTMPHKINPIDFENAEGNLGIANALLNHFANKLPISRLQRDLSDSTVLRNIGSAISYALLAYQNLSQGLSKLSINKGLLEKEVNEHWEVLAEPIQTMMRRYSLEAPYEQLKALTRGQTITKVILHDFIKNSSLPKEAKDTLFALTPATYIGLAEELAKNIGL